MTKYTEAQAKAIKKNLSAQAEIKLRMRPTQKDIIVEAAKESGDSIQAFILESVSERIDREHNGAEIPPEVMPALILWLRKHGHSEVEFVDCIETVTRAVAED